MFVIVLLLVLHVLTYDRNYVPVAPRVAYDDVKFKQGDIILFKDMNTVYHAEKWNALVAIRTLLGGFMYHSDDHACEHVGIVVEVAGVPYIYMLGWADIYEKYISDMTPPSHWWRFYLNAILVDTSIVKDNFLHAYYCSYKGTNYTKAESLLEKHKDACWDATSRFVDLPTNKKNYVCVSFAGKMMEELGIHQFDDVKRLKMGELAKYLKHSDHYASLERITVFR